MEPVRTIDLGACLAIWWQALTLHLQSYNGEIAIIAMSTAKLLPDPEHVLQLCLEGLEEIKKAAKALVAEKWYQNRCAEWNLLPWRVGLSSKETCRLTRGPCFSCCQGWAIWESLTCSQSFISEDWTGKVASYRMYHIEVNPPLTSVYHH